MESFKKFVYKYKIELSIALMCLVLLIFALIAIYSMFYPNGSKNIYGDRLEGKVEVKSTDIDKIITDLKVSNKIENVTYKENVKILKFFVTAKENIKLDDAKAEVSKIIAGLNQDVRTYYDIEVFLSSSTPQEGYPTIGYCHKTLSNFTWTKSIGEKNE